MNPYVVLSRREIQVAKLITYGLSNQEIADRLEIKRETVCCHVASILAVLNLARRTQVAIWALKEGLVSLDSIELPGMPEKSEVVQ